VSSLRFNVPINRLQVISETRLFSQSLALLPDQNNHETEHKRKWKTRAERHKHCELAVVRRSQKISPRRRPPSPARRTAKI